MSELFGNTQERRWYIVQTYSGYENKVKANLDQRIATMGMEDRIFRVLVPVEEKVTIKDGKTKRVKRKVFPSYVLVEMILEDQSWYVVRHTPGVTGFVGSGNKGIPLTDEEVAALGVEKREVVVGYQVGDSVKITEGALESFLGVVEEIDIDKNKVRVVVSMFGRETPVELDLDQVEPVEL